MAQQPKMTDVKTLRSRARQHIEEGAVTAGYNADRDVVVKLLNEALATEIVCVLRYRRHYFMARGIHSQAVAAEFLEHSNEEQGPVEVGVGRARSWAVRRRDCGCADHDAVPRRRDTDLGRFGRRVAQHGLQGVSPLRR